MLKRSACCLVICGLILYDLTATAADNTFQTSISLGVTITDGNSETLLGNASLLAEGERERLGSIRAGVEGNYGENTVRRTVDGETERRTETNVENVRAFANARKTLSERTFAYLDGAALYDGIAEIDYRFIIGPGFGTYLFKQENTSLSLEVGPSYIWEEVADTRDDYLALRLAERFEYAFSETARLWQTVELLPKANDINIYLLRAEIGVEASMNRHLNLRVVLLQKHDSDPGPDLKRNDLTLIAGIRAVL